MISGTFQLWLYDNRKYWKHDTNESEFDVKLLRIEKNQEVEIAVSSNYRYPQKIIASIEKDFAHKVKLIERNTQRKQEGPWNIVLFTQLPKECSSSKTCAGGPCNDVGDCSNQNVLVHPSSQNQKEEGAIDFETLNIIVIVVIITIICILVGTILRKSWKREAQKLKSIQVNYERE